MHNKNCVSIYIPTTGMDFTPAVTNLQLSEAILPKGNPLRRISKKTRNLAFNKTAKNIDHTNY